MKVAVKEIPMFAICQYNLCTLGDWSSFDIAQREVDQFISYFWHKEL